MTEKIDENLTYEQARQQLVAVVAKLGRRWGALALIVGVLSNPWLQVAVFELLR